MPYFAVAVARSADGWAATELDLDGVADVDDAADRLRDATAEAGVAVVFVESDDTYLAVLRLDEQDDLRVFGSDAAFVAESRLGSALLGEVAIEPDLAEATEVPVADDGSTEPAGPPPPPGIEPVGDPDLLTDLGVPAARLLALCAQEGMLPADVTAEVCQLIGCGDEVEELREV